MENMKLDLEILRSQVDSLQSLANSQETCSPNNNEVIRLQIELCDEKIKNRKLESELGLLASKRISEIDKLVNRIDSLEVKLGNSLNNTVIVENSREGNNVEDCQENLIVYEQNEINYQGNQRKHFFVENSL